MRAGTILSPHTGKPITSGKNGKVRNLKRNGHGGLKGYIPTGWPTPRYSGAFPGIDRGTFGLQVDRDYKDSSLIDQPFLSGMGRLLYMSQPTIHAIVQQFVQHVIGQGKYPHSQSEKGGEKYDAYFNEWSKKCTTDGLAWARVQEICFREMLVVGDVGILKTKDNGRHLLQLIEGHNIGNTSTERVPNENIVLGGVEVKKKGGQVVRYHLRQPHDPEPIVVKPSQFILMQLPERIGQTRGISRLALAVIDGMDEASILDFMKQTLRHQARLGGIIKRDDELQQEDQGWRTADGQMVQDNRLGLEIARLPLPAGTRYEQSDTVEVPVIGKDDDYSDFQSTRPNSNFIPFIEHVVRRMCLSVGVSADFLINSNLTDGPAMRKNLEQADYCFQNLCGLVNDQLNQPVYEFVISQGMLRGHLPVYPDWDKVDWERPRRLSVDIGRESKSIINEVAVGTKTRDEIHKAEGRSMEEVWKQKANEERMIMQTAFDLAREFGIDDVMAVRNAIASTGQVNEKPPPKEDSQPPKKKLDKDSSKS